MVNHVPFAYRIWKVGDFKMVVNHVPFACSIWKMVDFKMDLLAEETSRFGWAPKPQGEIIGHMVFHLRCVNFTKRQ